MVTMITDDNVGVDVDSLRRLDKNVERAMSRVHDYYVTLEQNGRLSETTEKFRRRAVMAMERATRDFDTSMGVANGDDFYKFERRCCNQLNALHDLLERIMDPSSFISKIYSVGGDSPRAEFDIIDAKYQALISNWQEMESSFDELRVDGMDLAVRTIELLVNEFNRWEMPEARKQEED